MVLAKPAVRSTERERARRVATRRDAPKKLIFLKMYSSYGKEGDISKKLCSFCIRVVVGLISGNFYSQLFCFAMYKHPMSLWFVPAKQKI
jgi:hypothetical protein